MTPEQEKTSALKDRINDPSLFSAETEAKLSVWYKGFKKRDPEWFNRFAEYVFNHETAKYPGHEVGHIIDVLNSALRITNEFAVYGDRPLTEVETFEVCVACLVHDTGKKAEDLGDKNAAFEVPNQILQSFEAITEALPEELKLRILHDIYLGKKATNKTLIGKVVNQADREQLVGTATIPRGLAYDVVMGDRSIGIPSVAELAKKLPIPGSSEDIWWLIQYEFYMRNLYPPVSPDGEAVDDEIKKENIIILLMMLRGMGEERLSQVFGPELYRIKPTDKDVDWSKKPIGNHAIFEQAQDLVEFVFEDGPTSDVSDLVRQAKKLCANENVILPENFDQILAKKLEECIEQERLNFSAILTYTREIRQQKRAKDLEHLTDWREYEDIFGYAADMVYENLQKRQRLNG